MTAHSCSLLSPSVIVSVTLSVKSGFPFNVCVLSLSNIYSTYNIDTYRDNTQTSKGKPDLTLKVTDTITQGDNKEHEWAGTDWGDS